MGWKPVTMQAHDIKKYPDKPVVGTFQGFTIISTRLGKQVIWEFTNEKGEEFGVYGFTNLNNAMQRVFPGTKIRITYIGTTNIPTKYKPKGQDVHQCRVEMDEDTAKMAVGSGTKKLALPDLRANGDAQEPSGYDEDGTPIFG